MRPGFTPNSATGSGAGPKPKPAAPQFFVDTKKGEVNELKQYVFHFGAVNNGFT